MKRGLLAAALLVGLGTIVAVHFGVHTTTGWLRARLGFRPAALTVDSAVERHGAAVRRRLAGALARAGLAWPPSAVTLLAFKRERKLEAWVGATGEPLRLLKTYDVLAASGTSGPKLREGDRQVPEGSYRIVALNPNSQFHLSLKVDYPSAEDRDHARREGRERLGGDIFVHGSSVSIGCLAIGDDAAEEIFVLAALARRLPAILIAPRDFRKAPPGPADWDGKPGWMKARYEKLGTDMTRFVEHH